ncbi:D-xylose-proton symporter, partial [human gut metagenome]
MYIAEIAPSNIRGTLVSWNQFAIIFGQLVVYFVNFLILGENSNPVIKAIEGVNQILNPEAAAWTTETGWRLMFVSEAVPAGVFALLVLFVPETPRYLAMSGKDDKALQVLSRINGLAQAKVILSQIKATAEERRKAFHLWLDGYLYRYHAECIPASGRYQRRTLFRTAYLRNDG